MFHLMWTLARVKIGRRHTDTQMTDEATHIRQLERRLEALRLWGERVSTEGGLRNLFSSFLPNLSETMNAERSTLFLYDPINDQLWSLAAQGEALRQFVVPIGKGIAGHVAKTGEALLVEEAYDDPRFDSSHDQSSGFRTRSVIAIPIFEPNGLPLGVIQVLNRRDGSVFKEDDFEFLKDMSQAIASTIIVAKREEKIIEQNRKLDRAIAEIESQRSELDLLVEIEQASTTAVNLGQFFQSLLAATVTRLDSERAFLIISTQTGADLFSFRDGSEECELTEYPDQLSWMRVPPEEPFVASGAEELPENALQFFDYFRKGPPGAVLAFPIHQGNQPVGTLVVMNPRLIHGRTTGYEGSDLSVFQTVSSQIGNVMERLRDRNEKLETERLAQVGQMLAGVAHDVRNPMTAISGFAQLMAINDNLDVRREMLTRIQNQTKSVTSMLTDVMLFSSGDTSLNLNRVSPKQLWEPIIDLIAPLAEPRKIRVETAFSGAQILIDDNKVRRVIFNLVKNALEASKRKQTVWLNIDMESTGDLQISVVDEAGGLPSEVGNALFKPFVTVGKRSGTGLGLSIVKRFVDDHQGTIVVDSITGKGTTFRVTIPAQVKDP